MPVALTSDDEHTLDRLEARIRAEQLAARARGRSAPLMADLADAMGEWDRIIDRALNTPRSP